MTTFEWTIGLLLGAVVLSGPARQVKVLPPTFLAIDGALLALVPARSAAATAVPRQVNLPYRMPKILEGESLPIRCGGAAARHRRRPTRAP